MADSYDRQPVGRGTAHDSDPPMPRTKVYPTGVDRAVQAVWWLTGFVSTLLAIRFFFKLFGANPVPFVRLAYDVSWPLIVPFHGIFNTDQVGRTVLEPECLVAIATYMWVGWGIVSLIQLIARPPTWTTIE